MDGYLPGEQRSLRLFSARHAAQERAAAEQSRWHLHRRDGPGRRARRDVRHGRRGRRLQQRWLAGHLRHRLWALGALPQQRRWDVHRRDRTSGRGGARVDDECGVVRLRQRWFAGSLCLQLHPIRVGQGSGVRRPERRPPLLPLLHSASLQADAEPPVSQQRRRDLYAGRAGHGDRERARQSPRRGGNRHQQRRARRSVRRQRHRAELPVRERGPEPMA